MAATNKAVVLPRRGDKTISNGQNTSIKLDVVPSETHGRADTITKHPVEEGSDISDHDRPEPDTLTLECLISNTPLDGPVDMNRAQSAWDALNSLRGSPDLLTIVTTLGRYTSMKITTLTATRTSETYNALSFTVAFEKIRIVKNRLTSQRVAKQKNVTNKVQTGSQTPVEDPIPQSRLDAGYENAQGKSGVDGVLSFFGGALK